MSTSSKDVFDANYFASDGDEVWEHVNDKILTGKSKIDNRSLNEEKLVDVQNFKITKLK